MGAPQEVTPDLASTTKMNSDNESPTDYVPDPSASFLERKDRLRKEAEARPRSRSADDQRGSYRGNTTSGAWLPLRHGSAK